MSPLTSVQEGVVGQFECVKLIVIGSDGRVEVSLPLSDDERRDMETHARGSFLPGLGLQVKTSRVLRPQGGQVLAVTFYIAADRIVNDPRFWYLFAHLDLKRMAFTDPLFLVPSAEVHAHAHFGESGGEQAFVFQASMKPNARDRWVPYRVSPTLLGKRVFELMKALRGQLTVPLPASVLEIPGMLWVGEQRAA